MSDRSCLCSRALHSWIFAWVVAEMTGDRLAGAKSWRGGVEHSQVKGLLSPCPDLNEDGVGGAEGRGGVSSWLGGSRGKSSFAERPGAGRKACVTARDDPAWRAASADTEGDLPKVRTAGAGPGNK